MERELKEIARYEISEVIIFSVRLKLEISFTTESKLVCQRILFL